MKLSGEDDLDWSAQSSIKLLMCNIWQRYGFSETCFVITFVEQKCEDNTNCFAKTTCSSIETQCDIYN